MKKYVKQFAASLLIILFFAGCSSSSQTLKELPENQLALTSWSDRSSGFGTSNYTAGQEEALADLESRFDVALLPSFNQLTDLAKDEITADGITSPEPEYTIQAAESELHFTERILFYQGENIVSYADITENYAYVKDREQVKVASEYFDMNFWSGGDSYVGTDFVALVEQVGELYVIPKEDLTAGLEKLATAEEYANQEIEIYNTLDVAAKNGNFGQLLIVELGPEGIPARITARVYDNRT